MRSKVSSTVETVLTDFDFSLYYIQVQNKTVASSSQQIFKDSF